MGSIGQWFFSKGFIGPIAVLAGLLHLAGFLLFVSVVGGWGMTASPDQIVLWALLTFVSCAICFLAAWTAHELARFNVDRPWYDIARKAEEEVDTLRTKLRSTELTNSTLEESVATLKAAAETTKAAAEAEKRTIHSYAEQMQFIGPRLEAAEKWLATQEKPKRIVSFPGHGRAEVQDAP